MRKYSTTVVLVMVIIYRHLVYGWDDFLTRCSIGIGWRNNDCNDHPISYLDTLVKTGSESIEAIMRRRWIMFPGFVARMEDTRLSKCAMFGELL